MSSGSETRQATKTLHVRLTPQQHDELKKRAADHGYDTVAGYVTARCFSQQGKRTQPPLIRQDLARVVGQLGKWGGNLNQIARAMNSGGGSIRADQIAELQQQVRELSLMVQKALRR